MYAEERQQAMAQLIAQQGRVSVAELAVYLSVTTETVRRDLSALERMGLVRRVHDGAVPASTLAVIESDVSERDEAATKRAIVAAGRRTIVLADSTRIGVEASLRFAALSEIDVLVADSGISDDDASALAAADVEVVIA